MTEAATPARGIVLPNGVTTAFTIPFQVQNASDVRVAPWVIATDTQLADLVNGTDYVVSNLNMANATFTTQGASSPWPNTYELMVIRDNPLTQTNNYTDNEPIPAATLNAALDKLTEICQWQADILSRCLVFNEFTPVAGMTGVLPAPQDGYALVWNGTTGNVRNTVDSIAVLEAQAAAIFAITADITTVAAISASVVAVAGNAGNINTVAADTVQVVAVGNAIAAVVGVYNDLANINLVAADLANINTVAGAIVALNAIYADLTALNAIYADLANLNNVAADLVNINAVAGDLANINAVAAALPTINFRPMPTVLVAGAAQAMAVNVCYIANRAGGAVAFTLPAAAAVGDEMAIRGFAAGGWVLNFSGGQNCQFYDLNAATSIASSSQYDQIKIKCIVANTTYMVTDSMGNNIQVTA